MTEILAKADEPLVIHNDDGPFVILMVGVNGVGKTTIFDAFTWLLFGKDSTDRKDFEIKTLDKNNKVIPQIEHEVSASVI